MATGQYSIETGEKRTFHAADYAVLGVTLALSVAIGFFYACKDRKRNTTDEFLLGGRRMHFVPVAMSLLSTYFSAIGILGIPAEVYVHGTMYWWICLGFLFAVIGSAHIFMPVFYKLGVTSVFQYAEMRFGKPVRLISSVIYMIWMLLLFAIVLYGPSLALNAVTGLSLWGSIVLISGICIIYTTLGGMKATLWADTFQMCIMFAGMLVLLIEGSIVLGGFSKAWEIAQDNGRIENFEFDADPRVRHSFWTLVVGGGLHWLANYGVNQAQVQRQVSVRSVRGAQIAIWLNWPGFASIHVLCCLVGVVMYAFYATCDPVKIGLVKRHDQIIPLLTMDLVGHLHGLPGLLLSTIFSATLSTFSSGLNAVSAVVLEDFIRPHCCKKLSPLRSAILARVLVVLFGLIGLALAFAISQLKTNILQLAYSIFGLIGGPVLGLFTLGMLFPWANKWGGGIGILTSFAFMLWIGLGRSITKTSVTLKPPVYLDGCNYNVSSFTTPVPKTTLSTVMPEVTTSIMDKYTGIQQLYTISYLWYSGLGMLVVVVIGMIVSLITGLTDTTKLNPKLICPFFDTFFPFLPEKIRKPLRFGVRHGEVVEETMEEKEKDGHSDLSFKNGDSKIADKNGTVPFTRTDYDNTGFTSDVSTHL